MLNRLFFSSRRVLPWLRRYVVEHGFGVVMNLFLGGVIAALLTFAF